jgi:hypothetical protein
MGSISGGIAFFIGTSLAAQEKTDARTTVNVSNLILEY